MNLFCRIGTLVRDILWVGIGVVVLIIGLIVFILFDEDQGDARL